MGLVDQRRMGRRRRRAVERLNESAALGARVLAEAGVGPEHTAELLKGLLSDCAAAGELRALDEGLREDQLLRVSGLVERICEHGVGHPDREATEARGAWKGWMSTHGCDGCCGRAGGKEWSALSGGERP